jgi:hypothetical protein
MTDETASVITIILFAGGWFLFGYMLGCACGQRRRWRKPPPTSGDAK